MNNLFLSVRNKLSSNLALLSIVALFFCTATQATAAPNVLHGKVKTVVAKSDTISLEVAGKGVVVLKVTPDTKYEHAVALKEFQSGEEVKVEFKQTGSENIAVILAKELAELPKGTTLIELKEVYDLVQQGPQKGNYALFDSRPAGRYHQGHIPSAIMLPFVEMKKADEQGTLAAMLPADKNKLLIFYCAGKTCVLSTSSAKLAVKHGYTNVRVFTAGEPDWSKADYPLESSVKFVKDDNILLIDLRSAEKFAAGHIARAVNVPINDFKSKFNDESKLPAYKGANIVFSSDNRTDIDAALEQMKDLGYTKCTMFTGGMERWKNAGIKTATGTAPLTDKLTFVRVLAPSEVSIDLFNKAVEAKNILIVDARSPSEFAAGHFAGAINVPSEEADAKCSMVPKDKPVYVHCASGARAGMLYDVLKTKGYTQAKMLSANVEFSNGKAKITE